MAANQYGIDLASVYRDAEAIKGARTQNKLSALKLGDAERTEAERPAKEAQEVERKNMLTGLREKSVTGDTDSQKALLAQDPKNGPAFIDSINKMDDQQIKSTEANIEKIGSMTSYVRNGSTLEEKKRRYQLVRNGSGADMQKNMPEEYSPEFVESSLVNAHLMDKTLGEIKSVRFGKQDVLTQDGKELGRADRPTTTGSGSGSGSSGMKSADESLMYRQSAELLGGLFDQAGNITNLDPTVRNKIQGIATEATKIFQQGSVTRTQAVKMAANKFGVDVSEAQNNTDNNNQQQDGNNDDTIRADGTKKGLGYLGVIKNNNGQDVTEFSIGVNIDGKEIEIPTVIPGLSDSEMKGLMKATEGNGDIPKSVVNKAIEHARKRIEKGLSPFKSTGDYSKTGSGGASPDGTRITNPTTGEVMIKQNGQWVKA